MTNKTWSLGIKLFNEQKDNIVLSQSLKNNSVDAERLLATIGKTFSKYLNEELSQKLIPSTLVHTEKYNSLDEVVIELEFTQETQQQSLALAETTGTIFDFFEAVLLEATEIIDQIYQLNPDYPEQVMVSTLVGQSGLKPKSALCAELVNKLRRTRIKLDTVMMVFPNGKTLPLNLKKVQNHSLFTSEDSLTLTGRIVDFSDVEQVFKLQENGLKVIHRINIPSLSIEDRNNLLVHFKDYDLINVTVSPRNKLISGEHEVSDYAFICYTVDQQKIA